MKRVTCREMAKLLGLSQPAVSMALRNHPSLPLKTRERVQALAAELGYRPDPVLSALNAYRQANRSVAFQSTIGCINLYASVRKHTLYEDFYQGAKQRAWELGFNLEEFPVEGSDQWERLPRILKSRGIEGLLILPSPLTMQEQFQAAFPWSDFSTVLLGQALGRQIFHLVINDQTQSAVIAVRELHALGYRRIGLVMPLEFAQATDYHFLGGYFSECVRQGIASLPLLDDSASEKLFRKNTARWIKKERLDAVIASGDGHILPALREANLRTPEDIAVAFLSRMDALPEYAHVDQHGLQIGMAAANQLVDLLRRNERGIPSLPMRHLIPGAWTDGFSAPAKLQSGARAKGRGRQTSKVV